jgi:hypothetical protein
MGGQAGLLELSAGSVLRLDGTDWTVAAVDACFGRVRLDSGRGDERWRTFRWLAHRDCQAVQAAAGDAAGPSRPRRPVTLDDLTDYQRANTANNRRPPPIDNRTRYRPSRATWRWCP